MCKVNEDLYTVDSRCNKALETEEMNFLISGFKYSENLNFGIRDITFFTIRVCYTVERSRTVRIRL